MDGRNVDRTRTEGQTDGRTERQGQTPRRRKRERQAGGQLGRHADRQTDRTHRPDRQAGRHRQRDRTGWDATWTGRHHLLVDARVYHTARAPALVEPVEEHVLPGLATDSKGPVLCGNLPKSILCALLARELRPWTGCKSNIFLRNRKVARLSLQS